MTLNAIFYVFAAVLYLAAAFGIYKTLQEPEPTEKFWIRPPDLRRSYDPGLPDLRGFVPVRDSALWNGASADDYAVHLHVPAALGKFLL